MISFQPSREDLSLINLILICFLKFVAFVLGFFTIRMGYVLVKDGVTGKFKFKTGAAGGYKAALESGSPGLLFVLLGIIFMGYAMFKSTEINPGNYTKTITETTTIIKNIRDSAKRAADSSIKANRDIKIKFDTSGH